MKKGFTLIELLAVIVVLAIILVIAIPNVVKIIEQSRKDAYIKNEEMLIDTTKKYLVNNTSLLPSNIGDTIEIKLSDLQALNLIEEIRDPKNSSNTCNGYVLVTKLGENKYDYKPNLNCNNEVVDSYISDGLAIYLTFDDGQALDYTPNNFHGVVNGPIASTNRDLEQNKALSFNGNGNYVNLGNNPALNIVGNITISVWIKLNEDVLSNDDIVHKEAQYSLLIYHTGQITWADSSVWNYATFGYYGMVSYNKWTQVTAVRDGGTVYIYENGELIVKRVVGGPIITKASIPHIGCYADYAADSCSTNYFNGYIDDILIYNRALSAAEVKYNYDISK